ncbi:MAG: DUF998 domain-containing protein [Candidatus Bathyarchaeia archaeon]
MVSEITQSNRLTWLRIAGICGIVGPIIAITCTLLAITLSPWFSWTKNTLSDLGVHKTSATLFNLCLITSGILILVFAVGLQKVLSKHLFGNMGALILALAAISLCAIGIFTGDYGNLHLYFSVAFFALISLSSFLVGVSMIRKHSGKIGALITLMGFVAGVVWVFPWEGVAIPETISSLAVLIWIVLLGIRLVLEALK